MPQKRHNGLYINEAIPESRGLKTISIRCCTELNEAFNSPVFTTFQDSQVEHLAWISPRLLCPEHA